MSLQISSDITLLDQTIPSGVYSALEEANMTESILYANNDVDLRWISTEEWTYELDFKGKTEAN